MKSREGGDYELQLEAFSYNNTVRGNAVQSRISLLTSGRSFNDDSTVSKYATLTKSFFPSSNDASAYVLSFGSSLGIGAFLDSLFH